MKEKQHAASQSEGNRRQHEQGRKAEWAKLQLIKPIDIETWQEKGGLLVAIDAVAGAGEGEVVMVVSGSSSRQTAVRKRASPSTWSIVAIIDSVDVNGSPGFREIQQRLISDKKQQTRIYIRKLRICYGIDERTDPANCRADTQQL